jgi:hypothetical protein
MQSINPKQTAFLKTRASKVPSVPNKVPAVDGILKKLKVSPDVRAIMQAHILAVGLDYRRFGRAQDEQGTTSSCFNIILLMKYDHMRR